MKEVLIAAGFEYKGWCSVCNGNAELYEKGNIKCKVKAKAMRFILIVNNIRIEGKANELQSTLEKYLPKETA